MFVNMKFVEYTFISFLIVLLCACSGSNANKEGVFGKVLIEGYEGKWVYLETTTQNSTKIDSVLVDNGSFQFTLTDSVPQVYRLVLGESADDMFPITLPIVSEKGHIRVFLGEMVLTSGTPLNDSLQDFLLAVSNYLDEAMKNGKSDMNKFDADFTKLIQGSVMHNINTPVGVYIYRHYGDRLTDEQKSIILSHADDSFKKAVK